jgi:hypothetical protein
LAFLLRVIVNIRPVNDVNGTKRGYDSSNRSSFRPTFRSNQPIHDGYRKTSVISLCVNKMFVSTYPLSRISRWDTQALEYRINLDM